MGTRPRREVPVRAWRIAFALVLATLALGLSPRETAGQIPPIVEFPLAAGSSPAGITAGPDGNVWFVEEHGDRVGKISPTGAITEFPVAHNRFARGITTGPDGALWFTELTGRIGRITPVGELTEGVLPSPPNEPIEIVAGSDGFLWYTDYYNRIGRLDPAPGGGVLRIPLAPGFRPQGITRGPDGSIWFTEAQPTQTGVLTNGRIGRIALSDPDTANVTEFPLPDSNSGPWGICAGPDGNVWFTEIATSRIGRITPAGDVTEFSVSGGSQPYGITAGSDGNLWFTETASNRIGRITPAGVVTEIATPTPGSSPTEIASGPDGNIWFTEFNGDRIGMIRLSACISDGRTLCLNSGRFQARISWSVPSQGTSGQGSSIPLTSDTGAFWFFSANNLELVVKVVDGRAVNGKFWVFAGVLTNVQYTLTVTDTQTGAVRTYEHAAGSLESFADTAAF